MDVVLALSAIVAGLMVAGARDAPSVSASFIVYVLAAAFLGPASAAVVAVLSEFAASARLRTSARSIFLINLPASVVPAMAVALLMKATYPHPTDTVGFYLVLIGGAFGAYALSFLIFAVSRSVLIPDEPMAISEFVDSLPSTVLNVLLVVAGASIYLKVGLRGIAFALTAVFAFSYMAHLLQQARHRSEQYVSLSWGVLAGLMRSLDI
ncbi:MAG TPA: hypothetical protein VGI87_14665, partial [Solirubrobacteraceae bacterium]